jgi:flavin reductase (DIM6/NTAB) family NADH-FMN oxidoreductase RutF
MEKYDSFTLCAFPDEFRKSLELLGSISGRNADKVQEAGLTPVASGVVAAPSFAEAELILECEIMYWNDVDPRHFLNESIASFYPEKDYHRIYYGEVIAIVGE